MILFNCLDLLCSVQKMLVKYEMANSGIFLLTQYIQYISEFTTIQQALIRYVVLQHG